MERLGHPQKHRWPPGMSGWLKSGLGIWSVSSVWTTDSQARIQALGMPSLPGFERTPLGSGSYTRWSSPFSSLRLCTWACAIFVLRPLVFPSRLSPVVTNSRQLSAQLGNWHPMCFVLQPRLSSTGRMMAMGYNCRGYLSITLARLQPTWEEQSFVFPLLRTG